jgi:hypothetical protein
MSTNEREAEDVRGIFFVSSMFGARSRRPLVSVTFRAESVDITPTDARALAYNLLDAAAAADYDGVIWDACHDVFDMDDASTAKMMHVFRETRAKREGMSDEPGNATPAV